MPLVLSVDIESYPVDGAFVIARGSRREAIVVVARVRDGRNEGRGEAVPYARYGETVEGVRAQILAQSSPPDRAALASTLPAGAARNALDCALWDLDAKRLGQSVTAMIGLAPPAPLLTAYTISLGTPEAMATKAQAHADKPLLKLKLGGRDDVTRLMAVRTARPDARIIVDANEGWRPEILPAMLDAAATARVELIEQPLPAGDDSALDGRDRRVPICADESVHTAADLPALVGRYDAINIKLDKTGGLTEAMRLRDAARASGMKVMVGCMLSTSLAMAPALLVAAGADWVDLDGPLLLARDRSPSLRYDGAIVHPATPALWG